MKIYRNPSVLLLLCCALLAGCASSSGPSLDLAAVEAAQVTNLRAPQGSVLSSGQPSRDQLEVMASAGVRHVVNLRTPDEEVDFDEQAAVEALGMRYYSLPVSGLEGIDRSNAERLQAILDGAGGEPVLVHCASGNRVGGLKAVQHFAANGDSDAAISEGERWGLTSPRLQQALRESALSN